MSKKVCKLVKKELPKEDIESYIAYILPANYLCKKCGEPLAKKTIYASG